MLCCGADTLFEQIIGVGGDIRTSKVLCQYETPCSRAPVYAMKTIAKEQGISTVMEIVVRLSPHQYNTILAPSFLTHLRGRTLMRASTFTNKPVP